MDLQRSLLIGAIAVLSFMLLTEWVAFKEDRTDTAAQETSRLINRNGTVAAELPELRDGAEDDSRSRTFPRRRNPTQRAHQRRPQETPAASSGRLIEVHTDVLQLAIDLQGGDIIELGLPKFLEKQDNPGCAIRSAGAK